MTSLFIYLSVKQAENQPTPEEQVLDALTRLAEKMTEPKKSRHKCYFFGSC